MHQQTLAVLQNFNAVDAFLTQSPLDHLVFLVHVDHVDVALFVGSVQHAVTRVPRNRSVNGFVGVLQGNLLGPLGCLKPFEGLVVRNSKNEVFTGNQQDLNYSILVGAFFLEG